jgi:hypothetical protein
MRQALIALTAVALCACGQRPAGGPASNVETAAAVRHMLPANIPAYAPVFNGALINSATGYANGGVVSYVAAAPIDKVAALYNQAATTGKLTSSLDTAGWKSTNPFGGQPTPGPRTLVYGQSGTARSLYVTLEDTGDGFTKVSMVYGAP